MGRTKQKEDEAIHSDDGSSGGKPERTTKVLEGGIANGQQFNNLMVASMLDAVSGDMSKDKAKVVSEMSGGILRNLDLHLRHMSLQIRASRLKETIPSQSLPFFDAEKKALPEKQD